MQIIRRIVGILKNRLAKVVNMVLIFVREEASGQLIQCQQCPQHQLSSSSSSTPPHIIIIRFSSDPRSHLDHLWLLSDLLSVTPPIILCAIVGMSARFFLHPRSHLDHLWLLSDLSSVTPPIIFRAVVRISARDFFCEYQQQVASGVQHSGVIRIRMYHGCGETDGGK